ncbi:hypothetical protein C1N87_27625 (plasmid) [Priestia aryabhattai]
MQTILSKYYTIALILTFFSMVSNFIWRDKAWPGYFTLCSFIVLATLWFLIRIDRKKNEK